MAEQAILSQGLLSRDEIEEIHRIFVMVDVDGSGVLTTEKIGQIAMNLTQNPHITSEEAYHLQTQLDVNRDGQVYWEDFLEYVCKWLHEQGAVRPKPRTDVPASIGEKETLHQALAQLFSLSHLNYEVHSTLRETLEDRLETWDYLGESNEYSEQEKDIYYSRVFSNLFDENAFQKIVEQLFHSDVNVVLSALEKIRDMLGVLEVFQSTNEHIRISGYLIKLFETLINQNLINRILQCLGADNSKSIQWETLKIITFFAPGPRIPEIPESYFLHPSQKFTKQVLMQTGTIQKILELCENECIEVRDQALLALGFIARHDLESKNYLLALGCMQVSLRILRRGADKVLLDTSSLIRTAWLLSILCGATMPRDYSKPNFSQTELKEITEIVVSLFRVSEDENLLVNLLVVLSYVLPYLAMDDFNRWILNQLVVLLGHENESVKRAALQTVRNLIWLNSSQCQVLTEVGLFGRITELLLNSGNSMIKLDTLSILRYLVQRGYTWELVNITKINQHLQYLIASDAEARWEAVKLLVFIVDSNSKIAIE